jgi:hypothetical protein
MAKVKDSAISNQFTEEPPWPTTMRSRLTDGRMVGTDNSVWVYREIPLSPVVDASSPDEALAAAMPLMGALEELAAMSSGSVQRRSVAKSSYREFHLLLVNVPQVYQPPRNHPIEGYLRKSFGRIPVDKRVLLLGVKLTANVGGEGGMREMIDSVVETLTSGGIPLSDFDKDFKKVDAAMTRAGLYPASADSIHTANAWWNQGRNPDTPLLVHDDHLHFFSSVDAVRMADKSGVDNCRAWDEEGIPGQSAVTFACVEDLDLPFIDATDATATWVSDLLDAQALAVSIRGQIEPAKITRGELRRQKKRYIDDIEERAQNNKMQRAEQNEMMERLGAVEAYYATGGTATLAGCSIVIGLDGQVEDLSQAVWQRSPVRLASMLFRQPGAMAEMMLCSNVRSNPNLHDLPSQSVAYSGLPSLSFVGDRDREGNGEGAQLGFTQRDRQPAFLSPTAASNLDGLPLLLCAGSTGSGKTMVLLNLADQYSRMGNPVIIIDPKMGSDHSGAVLAAGGQVASLDDLTQSDGVFDPIRFSATKEVGVELAASMLMSINPWGREKENLEVPLQHALSYGTSNGGDCIGQALLIAERELTDLPDGMVKAVFDLASSSPMFSACVGITPNTQGLRAAKGITLIKVGNSHLDLPEPGVPATSHTINQRVALALVRMMVFGSAMALTDRQGVVMLDEAWVFLGAGSTEVQRLGRLARSQQVLPMLFTQRVSDAIEAKLEGFISRGLILPIEDKTEALAACKLFRLEPTPERMAKITAKGTISGTNANSIAPNWDSMRALRDPKTNEVLRGSIAIYADIHGRAIPVEIALSPEFLRIASTNPEDIRKRLAAQGAPVVS